MTLMAIVAVATFNVNYNWSEHNSISLISLTNLEALAQNEEESGAKSILITDHGTTSGCHGNTPVSISSFSVSCIGDGNLRCVAGYFEEITYLSGYCGSA